MSRIVTQTTLLTRGQESWAATYQALFDGYDTLLDVAAGRKKIIHYWSNGPYAALEESFNAQLRIHTGLEMRKRTNLI